jgi:HK97 family phage portal protein
MGLFSGPTRTTPQPEARASYPALTQEQLYAMIGYGTGTYADINANGITAFQSIAVSTSIDLICSLASELPAHVYRGEGKDRTQLSTPGNLQDPGNTGQGLEDWIYCLNLSWLYRGNAYGQEIEWDSRGRATRIDLHHPDDVTATMTGATVEWSVNGTPVTRPDLFMHRRVNPVPGRVLGASVIEKHALQTGTSLAAARFGSQWFKQGAHPSGMLTNTEAAITRDQAVEAKARWTAQFSGSREPVVMGKGWEWKSLQATADESQFLETMRYSEAQCARMFGPAVAETLGYETGGSMTYANVVDRRSDLLAFTLNKWLRRTERILSSLLPSPQYVRFDRDALLASDTLRRYEAHAIALHNQFRTVNEVRDDEDMAPVPWGDTPNEQPGTPAGAGGN